MGFGLLRPFWRTEQTNQSANRWVSEGDDVEQKHSRLTYERHRCIAHVTPKQQRLVEANVSNRLPEANESLWLAFRRYMKCNEISG